MKIIVACSCYAGWSSNLPFSAFNVKNQLVFSYLVKSIREWKGADIFLWIYDNIFFNSIFSTWLKCLNFVVLSFTFFSSYKSSEMRSLYEFQNYVICSLFKQNFTQNKSKMRKGYAVFHIFCVNVQYYIDGLYCLKLKR